VGGKIGPLTLSKVGGENAPWRAECKEIKIDPVEKKRSSGQMETVQVRVVEIIKVGGIIMD